MMLQRNTANPRAGTTVRGARMRNSLPGIWMIPKERTSPRKKSEVLEHGANGRNRTSDLLFTKQLLCQLSYASISPILLILYASPKNFISLMGGAFLPTFYPAGRLHGRLLLGSSRVILLVYKSQSPHEGRLCMYRCLEGNLLHSGLRAPVLMQLGHPSGRKVLAWVPKSALD